MVVQDGCFSLIKQFLGIDVVMLGSSMRIGTVDKTPRGSKVKK